MSQSSGLVSTDRLLIHDLARAEAGSSFAEDVRAGLLAQPKKLLPKYFYDELGSQLFDAICLLPEYYPTRAENEILERYADEIASSFDGYKTLLEMGSGSASKTRSIIEALLKQQSDLLFIPVDISATALETSSRVLLQSYPRLRIEAYAGDYYDGLAALRERPEGARTLALFLGSNIGNFDADEAHRFLRALRGVLQAGDALLLGADLKKDAAVLEAAYDDALGVTAAFDLNLLVRINRELGADFNPRAFRHFVTYNQANGCVESYLVSLREQTVHLDKLNLDIRFAEGERIHTENSYKYDLDGLSQLAAATGFTRARTWLDEREQFSSNLFLAVE
ncbi:MAG: L-histidine N(alpha)-methyltransferase [Acidobacteria bacterium]|nr:L-histidine N(alpha)-methyltransferase [Acidobacteriota bacterium]